MPNRLSGAFAAIAILVSAAASAQTLSTTVTVDRVVEPTLRQANRPVWAPQLLTPSEQNVRLTPAEYDGEGTILSSMTPLYPLMWADVIEHTPYRGYASLGYFPAVNLGANAGYRFVDTKTSSVGAWAQYNGNQYTRLSESYDFSRDVKLRNHYVTAGAYANHRVGWRSLLDANIDYTHASVLRPLWTSKDGYGQGSNEFNARVGWRSGVGRFGYDIRARYQYFGFAQGAFDPMTDLGFDNSPVKQSLFVVHADLSYLRYESDDLGKFVLGLEWQGLHTSSTYGRFDMGIFKFHPHFNLGTGAFRAALGIKATLSYHDTELEYLPLILPDVRLSWAPSSLPVSAYINASYDRNVNPVSRFFAVDPYINAYEFYFSTTQLRIDGGVNLGAFRGFSLQAYASFASTAGLYSPYLDLYYLDQPLWANDFGGTHFTVDNCTRWLIGARLSYAYRSLIDASATFEFAPGDALPRWHEWLDGAQSVLRLHAGVRPMPRLSASIDYELRSKREVQMYSPYSYFASHSLGNANLLALNCAYDFTPSVTFFLSVENILNSRYLLISALPAQGIHGLLGATIKF